MFPRVSVGDALLAPSITRRLIEQFARSAPPEPGAVPPAVAELTTRELDVLRLVARGLSNAEIAAELVLGENTIKTHVANVLSKLGLRDRVQAVVLAYETGLVERELSSEDDSQQTSRAHHMFWSGVPRRLVTALRITFGHDKDQICIGRARWSGS